MSAATAEIQQAMADGQRGVRSKVRPGLPGVGRGAERRASCWPGCRAASTTTPETERAVVRGEFAKINRLRLQRLLAPPTAEKDGDKRTNLTTHVLDAASGRPAVGVAVRLEDLSGTVLGRGHTNDDGRIKHMVDAPVGPGSYRLVFDTASYHESVGTTRVLPRGDHLVHRHRPAAAPSRAAAARTIRLLDLPRELTHMGIVLGPNQYGKAENRVVRIYRDTERHEIRDVNVSTSLRGDFSAAHLTGDQADVLPTDTQKQTCYAYAKEKGIGRDRELRPRPGPALRRRRRAGGRVRGSRSRSTAGSGSTTTTTRGSRRGRRSAAPS